MRRIAKLLIFFILLAGNIVLLANWNSIFNPKVKEVSNRELTLKDSLTIFWDLKQECDRCRADILEFVRKRDISGCRSHSGWEKYLSSNERAQVESLLCLDKYDSEAKRRIQEYLSGKQLYSWKDVKDANSQVAIILKQNEKEREIGRSEMLNLVRKMCWYDSACKITRFREFEYFREHSGWKFLSRKEQFAVEAIYRALNGKIRFSKDLKTYLRDRKIHSWEDVIDIHNEIIKENLEQDELINKRKKAEAKAEVLRFVKKKDLSGCRGCPGWGLLTKEEQYAVEAILNLDQYKGATTKRRVKQYVGTLTISNWDDIMAARKEILYMINDKISSEK